MPRQSLPPNSLRSRVGGLRQLITHALTVLVTSVMLELATDSKTTVVVPLPLTFPVTCHNPVDEAELNEAKTISPSVAPKTDTVVEAAVAPFNVPGLKVAVPQRYLLIAVPELPTVNEVESETAPTCVEVPLTYNELS